MIDFIVDELIKKALTEDIGTGDITTLCTIPLNRVARGNFIAKESGVICGIEIVKRIYEIINKDIIIDIFFVDGDSVKKGDIIAKISGNAQGILTGERVSLNFLQLLSGIATKTNQCVKAIAGTSAKICDTRKTTPGLRMLEKYAVRMGGGSNHRFNLSDGVLIKDNHIMAAGSIVNAVEQARKIIPHTLKIEVEVENSKMIEEALSCKADIIMLDNMTTEMMRAAVKQINGRAIVEASGNMGDKDLLEVAKTGVDLISIGALTHTIRALDISLRFYSE